jgi:predicted transcriptional regulator
MKPDCDFINLKTEFVCKKMKISRPTLTRAISQLIDIGVLCKKTQSEYWINPFYIFKGNRIKFYNKTYPDCIEVSCKLNK